MCRPSMWFHHVTQSPDDNGRTIAVNYCKFYLPTLTHYICYRDHSSIACQTVIVVTEVKIRQILQELTLYLTSPHCLYFFET